MTPSRPLPAAALAALLLFALPPATRADVVTLRDGRVLEGRVVQRRAGVLAIVSPLGQIEVREAEVLNIRREPTADERYESRKASTDLDDPDALERLALWAREQGLSGRARDLEQRAAAIRERRAQARHEAELAERRARAEAEAAAREAALRQRRLALGAGDAPALYALARWAEGEGYPASVVDRLLREALLADPQLAQARVAVELREQQAAGRADRQAAAQELVRAAATRQRADQAEADARTHEARLQVVETDLLTRQAAVERRERQVQSDAAAVAADRQAARLELWQAQQEREQARDQLAAIERERAALCAERQRLELERCELERLRQQLRRDRDRDRDGRGVQFPIPIDPPRRLPHRAN